jgi:hypothetical protein
MFWSKIWLFLVAAAAAVALTVALLLPRPAERARTDDDRQRLVVACDVDQHPAEERGAGADRCGGRGRPAGRGGRRRSSAPARPRDDRRRRGDRRARGGDPDQRLAVIGQARPDFAILVDRSGRVLARAGSAGVDEAQLRRRRWPGGSWSTTRWPGTCATTCGRSASGCSASPASPVDASRDPPVDLRRRGGGGHRGVQAVRRGADAAAGRDGGVLRQAGELAVSSSATVLDREVLTEYGKLAASPAALETDCKHRASRSSVSSGKQAPGGGGGAAAGRGAVRRRVLRGLPRGGSRPAGLATARSISVRKDDLVVRQLPVGRGSGSASSARWAIGLGLLVLVEHDRPVRRLAADAVELAKGKGERLPEERHGGRLGSVARSVNIQIDKLAREARSPITRRASAPSIRPRPTARWSC